MLYVGVLENLNILEFIWKLVGYAMDVCMQYYRV